MKQINLSAKRFSHQICILGFGSIGKALLPVLLNNFSVEPKQIRVIDRDPSVKAIAEEFGVNFELLEIDSSNYQSLLSARIKANDFLVDVSYNISSVALVELCDSLGALYLNTSTEPWYEDWHVKQPNPALHTNYHLRQQTLALKGKTRKTAVITHGANPGLISHFVKQALLNIAQDTELNISQPKNKEEWAELAAQLNIKSIHIAERDTQTTNQKKSANEFVNTWSVYGLIDESIMPSELGWGTHERHWPNDAHAHDQGCQSSIYLMRSGAAVRARSWTPSRGPYHGWVISHAESTTLADYLTQEKNAKATYRPTVHYVYDPCPDASHSLQELRTQEWNLHDKVKLIVNDIVSGQDELGVLLMGNKNGAYWFGSTLSIEEARSIAPYNNATSLQVVAGIVSAMLWATEHPNEGVVEPEDIDHDYIMEIALPFLGKVSGHYTDWTPLHNREIGLAPIDEQDPWQFINIRVE